MPINNETLNADLFKLLKSNGYEPNMLDSSGELAGVPDEAEVFQFKFRKDGEDYGTVTASIDGLNKLVIYYSKSVADSPKGSASGDMSWSDLRTLINKWRFSKGIRTFSLKDESDLKYDMAKREHTKKLDEGYYPINKHSSYSDNVPNIKIKIMHTQALDENDQRFRKVARIYLENQDGERFLLDTKKPGIARVYARHLAEGGKVNDDRWGHIHSLVEDYNKMAGFVRATRNNQFNESTQQLISEGIGHYNNLRETLHRLSGKKGYNTYFESYSPTLNEDHMDATELSERFMSSSLDPRIESAMPILAKLSKKISEMTEVRQLEEWTDSIEESIYTNDKPQIARLVDKLSEPISVGVDAVNAKEILGDLGVREGELDSQLERLASKNPDADVSDDILDWMAQSDNHLYHKVVSNIRKAEQPPAQQAAPQPQQAPVQQESLRDGEHYTWTVHFDDGTSKNINVSSDEFDVKSYYAKKGKNVTKVDKSYSVQGQQHNAPKRSSDDSGERRDRDTKAHIQHDRKMTEQSPPNVPQGWEAKTQADGSTRISKIGSMSSAEYKQNMADYKAATAEKRADLLQRRASGQGVTDSEKAANYQQQQQYFGKNADQPELDSDVETSKIQEEGLDSNQKAAGQLGPTEKVKKNNIGKLVGANENIDPLIRMRKLSGLNKQ